MQNKAHSNDRNGVGVVDYVGLLIEHIGEDGMPEVKLDISLRMFMDVHRLAGGEVKARTSMSGSD